MVGSVAVQGLPPFDYPWKAGGRFSSSWSLCVEGEGGSWKTPFVLGLHEALQGLHKQVRMHLNN